MTSTAEVLIEDAIKVLPTLGTLIGFIPGAQIAPAAATAITALLKQIDASLTTVQTATSGSPEAVMQVVTDHLTPGQPNAPALS